MRRDLPVDRVCSFDVEVTEQDVSAFSRLSGDHNPLHVDAAYAQTTEYGRPIAHGGLLVGLVSRVLGMHIPGKRSLLLSMSVRFPKPLFYPATVRVEGRLKSFDPGRKIGVVRVVITDLAKQWPVLETDAGFTLHGVIGGTSERPEIDHGTTAERVAHAVPTRRQGTRARLLLTGGTGGLGSRILPFVLAHYEVCCLTRQPLAEDVSSSVVYDRVDVEVPGALEAYLDRQSPGEFYGVVHLSVPPVSRAFVSDDLLAVRQHLRHSVEVPLLLARWARQPGSGVKRMVLCGSTFGVKSPKPQLGAYALGKAAMEYLPRLLTADLAAQGATVNVITPTVLPVGLNEGMSERTRATLVGKMPTRRLVDPHDIANVLLFLLSDASAQINGVTIAVDGGGAE